MSKENENYSLGRIPRGFCVIINYIEFNHLDDSLDDRTGSVYDVDKLKILFEKLNFEVIIPEEYELEKKNVIQILDDTFNNKDLNEHEAIVISVNSHGNSNGIICSNGELVQFNEIMNKLSNINCKILQNKPKILMIDCCRKLTKLCKFYS